MTLCARVFDPVAMAECAATGHRWVTVRPWGDVSWRECRRCGQTGQAAGGLPAAVENVENAVFVEPTRVPIAAGSAPWRMSAAKRIARDEQIRARYERGETCDQLAAAFGVHRSRIGQIVGGRGGRFPRPRPDNRQRDDEIVRRVAAGERPSAIAREIGINPSRISQIVRAVAARQKETA